jgi:alpha-D-ribose 1-methylphosphonate 5-triphosphate diphosphatase
MNVPSSIRIRGGKVLLDDWADVDVLTDGAVLVEPGASSRSPEMTLDARGMLVLPGIVDIHGDAFERSIMPRPGVSFDMDIALVDVDRSLVANGITTAFHGVTWSWEPGLRGTENVRVLVDAIERLATRFCADTFIHLRHETFNLAAESEITDWMTRGRIGVLAFNDHMEGTLKARHRPDKIGKMVERSGLAESAFMDLVERTYARKDEVPASVRRLAAAARDAGIPMMSHDDMDPDMRRWYRGVGAAIAEFPLDEPTASEAAANGDPIVFGAPNVVRGGSHTGCVGAADMVAKGLCTILASDYYYPALVHAPFVLARTGDIGFADAWRLVSRSPARALGLGDRGDIASGLRADIVLVDPHPQPRVMATIAGGRLVHLADGRLIGTR